MERKHLKFRDLHADEIELRVGVVHEKDKNGVPYNDKWFTLLLYKTARTDANILDETVGAFNWQKKFYQVKNTMICSIGIYLEDRKEWVWKDDAGDESKEDAIKGEASDCFKRAGFAWGIGRELYSSPFILIKIDENNDPKKSRYTVKEIAYANDEITRLVIVNDKTGQVAFSMGHYSQTKPQPASAEPKQNNDKLAIRTYLLTASNEQTEAFNQWLFMNYGCTDHNELTDAQASVVVKKLKEKGRI